MIAVAFFQLAAADFPALRKDLHAKYAQYARASVVALRSQLVHHAKVPYRVATGSQEPG